MKAVTEKEKRINKIWKETSSSFLRWAENEIGSLFYFDEDIIYHYTNVAGLKGIVENNCLWATNLSFVNDSKEITLGLNVYRDVCKKMLEEKNDEQFKNILSGFLKCLNEKNMSNRYACSFTNNGDQLSQWRGYGLNGQGYAIGFEAKKLVGNLTPKADPSRIIYDVETQIKYVEKHITDFVKGFTNKLRKEMDKQKINDQVIKILEFESEASILSFKHKGFHEESENRLHLAHSNKNNISVFEKNGIIIPYIKLRTKNKKKLPIKKITIGPTADFDRARNGVRFLLEKNGFKAVEIAQSQIPFKG